MRSSPGIVVRFPNEYQARAVLAAASLGRGLLEASGIRSIPGLPPNLEYGLLQLEAALERGEAGDPFVVYANQDEMRRDGFEALGVQADERRVWDPRSPA